MKNTIITDRIEVRSTVEDDKPRYIVNGTAMIANKKHIYEYTKNPDGTYKTLKSMFTPHCIQSIKEQSKHKKLFVDSQHELGLNSNIKKVLKDKLTPEEQKKIDTMLKTKMLPLSKLNDIEIKNDRMELYTELNPMFKEVDTDHKNYFDAVWYSLENKYLNGISANFGNFKFAKDEQGDMVIDDVDVLGFSYVDAPAEHENTITEVAIRAMQEGNEGVKMEEEKKKLEAEKAQVEKDKKELDEEKEKLEKEKKDKEATEKETVEKETKEKLEKEKEDFEKQKKELEEKTAKLEEVEEKLNSAKGVIGQQEPPAAKGGGGEVKDSNFYKEQLNEITKEHDETFKLIQSGKQPIIDKTFDGFAQLVNLQQKAGNLTADLDKGHAEIVRQERLLGKGDADIIASSKKPA